MKHRKPADSYLPAACFAAFLLVVVFAPFKVLLVSPLAIKLLNPQACFRVLQLG